MQTISQYWIPSGQPERAENKPIEPPFSPDLPAATNIEPDPLFGETRCNNNMTNKHKYADNPQPLMTAAIVEFLARISAQTKDFTGSSNFDRAAVLNWEDEINLLSTGLLRRVSIKTKSQAFILEARALKQSDLKLARPNAMRCCRHAANEPGSG